MKTRPSQIGKMAIRSGKMIQDERIKKASGSQVEASGERYMTNNGRKMQTQAKAKMNTESMNLESSLKKNGMGMGGAPLATRGCLFQGLHF